MYDTTLGLVKLAQKGNPTALEQLIREQESFIQNTASQICKRKVNWNQDDELSIALIAFHEAVEKYMPDKGAHFLTFARHVIQQRLIDFFRKEQRHHHLPIQSERNTLEEKELGTFAMSEAINEYNRVKEQEELATTIEEFEESLLPFGISMDDLVDASPRHRDTRENLLRIALQICSQQDLIAALIEKKKLPIKELMKRVKVSRRVLENGRKYLIALVLIISESQFAKLKYFAGIEDTYGEGDENEEASINLQD